MRDAFKLNMIDDWRCNWPVRVSPGYYVISDIITQSELENNPEMKPEIWSEKSTGKNNKFGPYLLVPDAKKEMASKYLGYSLHDLYGNEELKKEDYKLRIEKPIINLKNIVVSSITLINSPISLLNSVTVLGNLDMINNTLVYKNRVGSEIGLYHVAAEKIWLHGYNTLFMKDAFMKEGSIVARQSRIFDCHVNDEVKVSSESVEIHESEFGSTYIHLMPVLDRKSSQNKRLCEARAKKMKYTYLQLDKIRTSKLGVFNSYKVNEVHIHLDNVSSYGEVEATADLINYFK
jgi:hypothetical protein